MCLWSHADDRAEIELLKPPAAVRPEGAPPCPGPQSRGLTQRDVAAAMGLTAGRVSQIERGEVTSVEVLGRYAGALGGRLRVVIEFGDELIAV
jgi:hypothetical protein